MASAATVREWMADNGRPQVHGALPKKVIAEWDAEHPGDPYQPGGANGFLTADDMEDMFPGEPAGAGELLDGEMVPETRPRPVPKSRPGAKAGRGVRGIFGGRGSAGKAKGKKRPRVSTESLIGSLWRGAAKLATPLPPLHRTLRLQSVVAGPLLEDAVRDTVADTFLQPLARVAEAGKAVNALIGPPLFVAGMQVHLAQRAAQGLEPNPVFMTLAQEGLRSSLMALLEVAGDKFVEAAKHDREMEERYGGDIDWIMGWLYSPPPATTEEFEAEESVFRRIVDPEAAPATM